MYIGKRYDGFEYAVNTLMKEIGLYVVPEADIYSHRLTAFSYHDEGEQWFYPILNWVDYMNRMLKNMGIYDNYTLAPFSSDLLQQLPLEKTFLLGEVYVPNWDASAIHKICHDNYAFLVCKKTKDGFIINNPLGCISMPCFIDQIKSLTIPNRSFIFVLNGDINCENISRQCLIKQIYQLVRDNSLLTHIHDKHDLPIHKKDKISFHVGLVRYVQARIRLSEYLLLNSKVKRAFAQIPISYNDITLDNILVAETAFLDELEKKCKDEGEDEPEK